jgi:hypothetical protein
MRALGIGSGTPRSLAVFAAIRTLTDADDLPGPIDVHARFAPGYAYVRRVPGQNLWIWYRFDDEHVDAITLKDEPPVPVTT